MAVSLTDRIVVRSSVICRELSGETVLLNLESGVYYGLDVVGTRVWQLLLQDKTLADVCDVMSDEFDVSRSVLQEDVAKLVGDLCEQGIVARRDASHP